MHSNSGTAVGRLAIGFATHGAEGTRVVVSPLMLVSATPWRSIRLHCTYTAFWIEGARRYPVRGSRAGLFNAGETAWFPAEEAEILVAAGAAEYVI